MKKTIVICILAFVSCGKISNDYNPSKTVKGGGETPNGGDQTKDPVGDIALAEIQDFTVVKNDKDVKKFSEIFEKTFFVMVLVDHECNGCQISALNKVAYDEMKKSLQSDQCDFGVMVSRNALRHLKPEIKTSAYAWGVHLSVNTIAKRFKQKPVDKSSIYLLDRSGNVAALAKGNDVTAIAKACH